MCLTIRLATDRPLLPPYDPMAAGLIVRGVTRAAGRGAWTRPHVHAITMAGACGCEFRRPGGRARRALVSLLDWVLTSVPEAELVIGWEGDAGMEPLRRDWATPAELAVWRELEAGDFLVIRPDA
jgi:hypothetical protein